MLFDSAQIVFDTETTGLKGGRVVEIGAVVVDCDGKIVSEFETLVRQPRELLYSPQSTEAFGIHKIDREEILESGLTEEEAGIAFANWIAIAKKQHGVNCIRAFNNRFDIEKIRRYPLDPFTREPLAVGDCIMLASMPSMIATGTAVWTNRDWVQNRCNHLGLPEDHPERYKWPSAMEATTHFEALGYHIPDEVEHRALPDARREAAIAIAIQREMQQDMPPIENTEFKTVGHVDLDMMTISSSLSQCENLGAKRYDELAKSNANFICSDYSHESPSNWVTDFASAPEGGNLTEDAWIDKYGTERLKILEIIRRFIEGIEQIYCNLGVCPGCGDISRDKNGDLISSGGRIVYQSYGNEDGGVERESCNSCQYLLGEIDY